MARGLSVQVLRLVVLTTVDFLSLGAAWLLAFLAWARPVHGQPVSLYLTLVPFLSLFLLGYLQADLYPGFGLGPVETLRRTTLVTGFGFLALAAFTFAAKLPQLYSRVTVGIACVTSLVLVPLSRHLVTTITSRWSWWSEPVVIIGSRSMIDRTLAAIREIQHLGYRPVAALAGPSGESTETEGSSGLLFEGNYDQIPEVAQLGIQTALLESDSLPTDSTLDFLQSHFLRVLTLHSYEALPVEGTTVRNLGGALAIEYTNNLLRPHNRIAKWFFDILVAGIALVFFLPLIALAAAGVKILSRGPAFFSQERRGLGGKPIRVHKIRTMYLDAEKRLERHLQANPAASEEWHRHFKLERDPRIIPVIGKWLRKLSIDELPQLWNVLKGEMSLVGPRPFPDYHLEQFPFHFRRLREQMRPGITGLWQVAVRSSGSLEEQQAYDTYYLRNWSVWLDVYVLVRTLQAVLAGRGAY